MIKFRQSVTKGIYYCQLLFDGVFDIWKYNSDPLHEAEHDKELFQNEIIIEFGKNV